MRLVQRRLLVKLDDKKSGTLDGVLLLFERTQSEIAAIMRELGAIKSELAMYIYLYITLYNIRIQLH